MKNFRFVIPVLLALAILAVCVYFVFEKGPLGKNEPTKPTVEKTDGAVKVWDMPLWGTSTHTGGNTNVTGPNGFQP